MDLSFDLISAETMALQPFADHPGFYYFYQPGTTDTTSAAVVNNNSDVGTPGSLSGELEQEEYLRSEVLMVNHGVSNGYHGNGYHSTM